MMMMMMIMMMAEFVSCCVLEMNYADCNFALHGFWDGAVSLLNYML